MAWSDDLDKTSATYAIAAAKDKRMRVIAGPGTGKTFAMKRRVARLLEEGVKPKRILAVTFTRVAAEDLHRELVKLGVPGCEELEGRTLHSLGLQILSRKHVFTALGRIPQPLNMFEEKTLRTDLALGYGGKKKVAKLIGGYLSAWALSQGDEPGFPANSDQEAFASSLLGWLKFHEAMLIGEIVPYLLFFLKHNPTAKEHSEYDHVLIDEYQDLNKAEQTIMNYFCAKADACIVGDDDQSIYSFKHANPEGIRQWHTVNAGTKDYELNSCQRCPTTVVKIANSLISKNENRLPRTLVSIAEKVIGDVQIIQFESIDQEVIWIAKKAIELIDTHAANPGDIIVLVQRRLIARRIIDLFRLNDTPAKSFYEESQLDTEEAQEKFALFKLFLKRENCVALRYLLGMHNATLCAGPYARLRSYCEENGVSPCMR